MSATQSETSDPWRPCMVFRAGRRVEDVPCLLEQFIETSATTFFRSHIPDTPNADFGPMMNKATRYVIVIDLFLQDEGFRNAFFAGFQTSTTSNRIVATVWADPELIRLLRVLGRARNSELDQVAVARANKVFFYHQNPHMLDQLVWAITHPDHIHPDVRADLDDRFFIAVLLIHHFKHHGGLVLPNLEAARTKEADHQTLIDNFKMLGRCPSELSMHYPNWRHSLITSRPPGLGGPPQASTWALGLPPTSSTRRPIHDPASGRPNYFGAIGDGRRPGTEGSKN